MPSEQSYSEPMGVEAMARVLSGTRTEAVEAVRFQDGVLALLGVLNGGGHPWQYNVITEAAEDALRAAPEAMCRS